MTTVDKEYNVLYVISRLDSSQLNSCSQGSKNLVEKGEEGE